MREILFRGKDKDGNWVEGDLVHDYIALQDIDQSLDMWPDPIPVSIKEKDCFPVEVIPETVGQFTGTVDKNGVKIFEGDIVSTSKGVRVITYKKGCYYAEAVTEYSFDELNTDVVLGSIYDNPKLSK